MKKILLATTAVVALTTVSADAFAAEKIKLSLGGFMRQYVAVTNHDEVAATANTTAASRGVNLGLDANSEVYFRGGTKLDNGLALAVDIQMESSNRNSGTTGRNFDVVSLEISSDAIGAVTVGSSPTAASDFMISSPTAVGTYDWFDTDGFALTANSATTASAKFASVTNNIQETGNKGLRLKYVSPNFSGVNVYGSYTASDAVATDITGASNTADDAYTYGIAFGGEIGGASVSADLTHLSVLTNTEQNHFGLNVGMAGFTVGGSYTDFNESRSSNAIAALDSTDGNGWDIGVGYETGPYTVTASYMEGTTKGLSTVAGDNKDTKWRINASYDLGAGVALSAMYWDSENTTETAVTTDDYQVSGFIAGIEVGF